MEIPNGKVVLQFTASWCGPCRVLLPRIEKIMKDAPAEWILVDVDAEPGMREEYNVLSVPTVVLLNDGEEVSRHIGAPAATAVQKFIS